MNCIIPGQNIKVLAKTFNSLAKIGDEIYIEAKKDKLTIVTFNMSKTVCAEFSFFDSFFSSYEVELDPNDNEPLSCKIFMKVVLPLFKGNLEKKLDFLKLEYETNSDFIIFKMKYKCDQLLMTHKLRLMDSEKLSIGVSVDSRMNNLCSTSTLFNQLLSMFNLSDDEITLEITTANVTARNYYTGTVNCSKLMRCEVKLNPREFSIFKIVKETLINFSLKPLRIAISFAETFNLNMGMNFDTGGKPLSLIMKNPTFEGNFIVSSLNPLSDMQSSLATTSLRTSTSKNKQSANMTIEDQNALENMNWNDCDMEMPKTSKTASSKSSFISLMKKVSNKSDAGSLKVNHNSMLKAKDLTDVTNLTNESHNLDTDRPFNPFSSNPTSQNEEENDADIIPRSPESPRRKRIKNVFARCYESTFHSTFFEQEMLNCEDSNFG